MYEMLNVEHKLCFYRDHDIRVSLNTYQSSEFDDPTIEEFVGTVHKPDPNTLAFVPQDYNKDWTTRIVRHKKRRAYSYGPNKNYIVTVSSIDTYDIKTEDLNQALKHNVIKVKPEDWITHHELEVGQKGIVIAKIINNDQWWIWQALCKSCI